MESAIPSGESAQICFEEDIKIVLDGTKKMMELMEFKKEEIARLEQDVSKHENISTSLKSSVWDLKKSINKNIADIENRTDLANIIEEYKNKFIPTAQMLYTMNLDFNKQITFIESTLNECIDQINENEEILKTKIQNYKKEEELLTKELDETRKAYFKDTENKEALANENMALTLELENLNKEELYHKKLINAFNFEENNNNLHQEIIILNEECKNNVEEILVASKSFHSINLQSQDGDNFSTNINTEMRISELENDLQQVVDELNDLENKQNSSNIELLKLKESITNSEIDLRTLSNKSEELSQKVNETQDWFNKEILSHTESLTNIEVLLKHNCENNSRLSEKIEAKKTDVKLLNSYVDTLKVVIADLVETPKEELEVKQDKLHELNLELEKIEETYKQRLTERQELLQAVITETENENAKITEYIRIGEEELKKMQNRTILLQKEIASEDNILQNLNYANRRTLNSKPKVQSKKLRNWDSDSTIGEEK